MPAAESYVVKSNDKDNLTCVVAEFAAQFVIEYTNVNNENVTTYLDVVDAKADPANLCINKVNETKLEPQNLVVLFGASNKMTLRFVQADGARYVDTVALSYTPDPENFPGYPDLGPIEVTFENQTLFKVIGDNSYLCKAETTLHHGQVTVNFDSVHVDSFRVNNIDNSYRKSYECQTDTDVNDMVPIAVGIALLALVVIVLIAYFIGRRRSRRLAYQSV
jgi:lysosomal-associated membrane protein 1/2